ncbi:hypothetical protein [Streptomyces sp. NPDC058657]|uniref:hypothetical protein n=1 Tax=unclassified Streptomyces TaxID=2593676 RepID=UPI003646BA06
MPEANPPVLVLAADGTSVPLEQPNTPTVYADPAAWSVVQALRHTLAAPLAGPPVPPRAVGVLVCSTPTTARTMDAVAAQAAGGRVRPRHFAAAGPATLAALPALVLGFRGPTLTLTCDDDATWGAARTIARAWLAARLCERVLLVRHTSPSPDRHHVTCEPVGPGAERPCPVNPAMPRKAEPEPWSSGTELPTCPPPSTPRTS